MSVDKERLNKLICELDKKQCKLAELHDEIFMLQSEIDELEEEETND